MKRVGQYWVPDHETLQLEALEKGPWQIDHLEAALAHVTCWDAAIDGGAHVGTWTMAMAERFATVIAFEPARDTYECLEANLKEWRGGHMDRDNLVILRRRALGAVPAQGLGLADDGKYHGGNTGGRYLSGRGDIAVETIDGLVNLQHEIGIDAPRLGFVKLDLEGYELFALQGARETLLRDRPIVLIEDKVRMAHRYQLEPHAARDYCLGLGMKVIGNVGADWILGW